MRTDRTYLFSGLVGIMLILLSGCGKEQIVFSTADITFKVPSEVGSDILRVYMFDASDGSLCGSFFMQDYRQEDGFTVFHSSQELRCGKFDLLAYNMDAANTFVRGESSISTIEAYTDAQSDSTFYMTDYLAVVKASDIEIKEGATISAIADVVTVRDTIRLKAEGARYAVRSNGNASGFAVSYFLGSGKPSYNGRLYFDMAVADSANLVAPIVSFGGKEEKLDFSFKVVTSSASYIYSASTDGSLSFSGAIVIPAPDKPSAEDSGSGFQPQVGDWKHQEIIIPI